MIRISNVFFINNPNPDPKLRQDPDPKKKNKKKNKIISDPQHCKKMLKTDSDWQEQEDI